MMMSRDPVPTVSVADVAAAREDGMGQATILLDVRNPDEFAQVRVPGAVFIPLPVIAARFRELPADRPIHVICHAGSRSAMVTQFLIANGYGDVSNVAGGMIAWLRAGYPTLGGPPADGEGALEP
ncbi:MAG TPA: rhodanese-like domain-containing protein [Candidatus Limnocylindrales bacterium]|nr:rhodanese-like domain-containing protein [Candidatus Limnocylindrales bacterium]